MSEDDPTRADTVWRTATSGSAASFRFSQCNLWQEQRRFYQDSGVAAWSGKIPYQITANPVIANAYAQVLCRFLEDHARANPGIESPALLLELGSGPGLFGFYLVTRLLELLEQLDRKEQSFVYVMTDLAERNVAFWRTHPSLSRFVEQGVLDFAQYDVGTPGPLHLLESGLIIEPGLHRRSGGPPLIVLANYLFDTLPQDIFRIEEGRLLEGRTKGLPEGYHLPALNNVPVSLHQLGVGMEFHEARLPYYGDPILDRLLELRVERMPEHIFLFPIQSLLALRNLIELADGELLLVATDKADLRQSPEISIDTPDLVLHDASFSLTVDFTVITEYFETRGGEAIHQSGMQPVNTSLFYLGKTSDHLIETRVAVFEYFHQFGPGNLHTSIQSALSVPNGPPELLPALLDLARWDPALVNACIDSIVDLVRTGACDRELLITGMRRSADQFYYLPGSPSTLVNVGVFFQELGDFRTALAYFERSLAIFGEKPADLYANTLYNMGLCHYHLDERDKALAAFRGADAAAPWKDILTKGWIYQLTVEEARLDD